MQIDIQTIPHNKQRYNTVGDWWFENRQSISGDGAKDPIVTDYEVLCIRVSEMGDWRYEQAVALHEQYEALLCYNDGIDGSVVDKFDQKFEDSFNAGMITSRTIEEPGDHPEAPYYKQHAKALAIEHMFLADTDVVRYLYNEAMDELYRPEGIGVLDDKITGCD